MMFLLRPADGRAFSHRDWLFALIMMAATLLAYQPAWNGAPIWDDGVHLTTPQLRSWHGLVRIWTDPGAAPQYYPVLHSVFWLEHKLWGDFPLPYHLVNILLHVSVALGLVRFLQCLSVPGAWLAAAVFALHPVQVESVAWISELKNTLSGAFCVAAALVYLRFDRDQKRSAYILAFALFLMGLMTKSVIATLPAAMLIVFWWKRGRLAWKRDVRPLVPFFATGIAAGLFTAWVERRFCGAEGKAFELSVIERILIAGRAFWFYLGKLFWPADLIVIYPRWQVSAAIWWQYLFPIAALILLAVLWAVRRRWRAPLAGLLIFVAMLFPMLSFLNISYFMCSFVADHFQYLACIGIITPVSSGAALLAARRQGWQRSVIYALCLALLMLLASLTWQHSRIFRDAQTCYRSILAQNPNSQTAHSNLGGILVEKGLLDEAIVHYQRALEIQPDYQFGHFNLAAAFLQKGRLDDAILHFGRVLELNPNHAKAYYNLANAVLQKGQTDLAIAYYERALKVNPEFVEAHGNLGNVLLQNGQIDQAIAHYQKAIELQPANATAHYNLGAALFQKEQMDEAIAHLQEALQIQPGYPDAEHLLDMARQRQNDLRENARP